MCAPDCLPHWPQMCTSDSSKFSYVRQRSGTWWCMKISPACPQIQTTGPSKMKDVWRSWGLEMFTCGCAPDLRANPALSKLLNQAFCCRSAQQTATANAPAYGCQECRRTMWSPNGAGKTKPPKSVWVSPNLRNNPVRNTLLAAVVNLDRADLGILREIAPHACMQEVHAWAFHWLKHESQGSGLSNCGEPLNAIMLVAVYPLPFILHNTPAENVRWRGQKRGMEGERDR